MCPAQHGHWNNLCVNLNYVDCNDNNNDNNHKHNIMHYKTHNNMNIKKNIKSNTASISVIQQNTINNANTIITY